MSWDNLKEMLGQDTEMKLKEVGQLNEAEVKKHLDRFKLFLVEELKKEVNDRHFYEEDGIHTVVIRFPKKAFVDRKIAADPKQAKNKAWQWWGPQVPLLRNDNGNPIITMFMPKDWKPQALWEPEDKKQLFVFRGVMKRDFKWLDDPAGTYARSEDKFIKEAVKRYEDPEIESITDIDPSDIDRIKYTFNAEQKLMVL